MHFSIYKTKNRKIKRKFNLTDPKQEKEYFRLKVGEKKRELKEFLKRKRFLAFLIGKKNSGKGTYSKMLAEVLGGKIFHFSIGDMIREVEGRLKRKKEREELMKELKENYRGFLSPKEVIEVLKSRDTKKLLPTELILNLTKIEILKKNKEKKSIFVDGFPRDFDQITFSLFFKDLISFSNFSDIFVLIDVPNEVIEERIKWRRICPLCQTSRNLKLLPTSKVGYDKKKKEFYLICDNPKCKGKRMVQKEGDSLGIKPIKERLKKDEKLMEKISSLKGIPKIFLKNSFPAEVAKDLFDDYEITPEFYYQLKGKEVKIYQRPWKFLVNGKPHISLLPQPVVVSFLRQLTEVLNL